MRISIVTPSYNQSRYLEQTIRSVLDNTLPGTEYFVIDGNSSDSSPEIIRKYEHQLTGWVSEKDKGQAEAINKGLQRCSGDIVAWLNSDDYYLPGALETVLKVFEENPTAGLVFGNVLSVDADGNTFNRQTFRPISIQDLMSFYIISQPAVFMRRSVLQKAGLLDLSYHYLLDHQLWLRMGILAPTVHIPQFLAAARYHAEAKNLAHTSEFGKEAFRIVDWMKNDPAFAGLFSQNQDIILGGAHRLNAFYLLDGQNYAQALHHYRKAFTHHPPSVARDWHRLIYAFLALLGLHKLRLLYSALRKKIHRY